MAKEKAKTAKYRKPYYELSDAIIGFKTAANTDERLKQLAKKLADVQAQIHKHLQSNYIWD